jgi:hypothetical protein
VLLEALPVILDAFSIPAPDNGWTSSISDPAGYLSTTYVNGRGG